MELEINTIKDVLPLDDGSLILIYFMAIISFIGSLVSYPESWGLMGLVISKIKSSVNTKEANIK